MKPRIKSMIWNIRNRKITTHNNKKRIKKKMRRVINSLWDNFKRSNICLIWGASRRRERASNW